MRGTICGSVLLAGAIMTAVAAAAQKPSQVSTDLAVTYTLERSKTTGSGCNCFWLNGGSAEGAVTFYRGLGIAASFSGSAASNVAPGVNFAKLSYLAGPRLTISKRYVRVFGEALFGGVHGFDSLFPATPTVTTTANAFALQAGGGMDVPLRRGFSVRALELDYVRTTLPNDASNSQNDLRLGFGIAYRLGRH